MPDLRVTTCNEAPVRAGGAWVLYWMTGQRRAGWNFALDRALEWARRLEKPLVVLEALRVDYPHASDRLHRFALEGMADNARHFERAGVLHHAYVEPEPGAARGLLEALAKQSCVVVTDDAPVFFLPRMLRAAAARLDVRLEKVDSNGLLPLRAPSRVFTTAFSFRAYLQKELAPHLDERPTANPLARARLVAADALPSAVARRWPAARAELLDARPNALRQLPIDHAVGPAAMHGGTTEARRVLREFVSRGLEHYADDRNHPDLDATSGLSPWLHWGHVSAHEVFAAIAAREDWTAARLTRKGGRREGWWGMSPEAEAFLDQLVTWRELGFNFAHLRPADYDRWESLPPWARRTLDLHAGDDRPIVYTREELEGARTHDELWNAAQRQLVREGRLHNYLRMLWGKKLLEWSRSPREAFSLALELNDRWAVDGRDPNSVSGVAWVFGRYDRPWGPERPIFGTVRYMSSENTRRKLRVRRYLERFGA